MVKHTLNATEASETAHHSHKKQARMVKHTLNATEASETAHHSHENQARMVGFTCFCSIEGMFYHSCLLFFFKNSFLEGGGCGRASCGHAGGLSCCAIRRLQSKWKDKQRLYCSQKLCCSTIIVSIHDQINANR